MARNKGDKDYSKSEKQLLISLINDYSLLGATDNEIIEMLSTKIGKKISETLFYRLKKEARRRRGDYESWLDSFARFQYAEYYRKRIEELEYVQRKLLEYMVDEIEKPKYEKKDKTLINQLSKTIADNSKVLAEFGYAPPLLSKIKSLMSENYSPTNKEVDKEIEKYDFNGKNLQVLLLFTL